MFTTPSRQTLGGGSRRSQSSIPGSRGATPMSFRESPAASLAGSRPRKDVNRSSPTSRSATYRDRRSHLQPYIVDPESSGNVKGFVGTSGDAMAVDDAEGSVVGGRRATLLDEGTILARDDVYVVSASHKLPIEVMQALESAEHSRDAITSAMDARIGYAYVAFKDRCYAWCFSGSTRVAPACYVFPAPPPSTQAAPNTFPPFCAFVERSSGQEPGLLLVSREGKVRLWNSIASSRALSEDAHELDVALGAGESVTSLQRCQTSAFVVATSQSRLLRLDVPHRGGRLQAEVSSFSQPRGFFGRFFGAAATFTLGGDESFSVTAAPSPDAADAWTLYAISKRGVQKWGLGERSGGETMIAEQDLRQPIASVLFGLPEKDDGSGADTAGLELLSGAITTNGALLILFEHSPTSAGIISFGVAVATYEKVASSFVISRAVQLHYTHARSAGPSDAPRLIAPYGGPVLFIQFEDVVVLRLLEDDFEEVVSLKHPLQNRFMGYGAESIDVERETDVVGVPFFTSSSGTLLVDVWVGAAAALAKKLCTPREHTAVRTERLMVKLEQAVFFGNNIASPISYDLPLDFEGDLSLAAEQLSTSIVTSETQALPDVVELRLHLQYRAARLHDLITFIASNNCLQKLSHSSRRRLSSDAELLAAALEVWQYHGAQLSGARGTFGTLSPLSVAITKIMTESGQATRDDVVRAFFRHHLPQIPRVLDELLHQTSALSSSPLDQRSVLILESARVVNIIFNAARVFRRDSGKVYAFQATQTAFEAWSITASDLDVLEGLFHTTLRLVNERTRELGTAVDANVQEGFNTEGSAPLSPARLQKELKLQLCELASNALATFEERLAYLNASAQTGDQPAHQRDYALLEARYRTARPQMILPLLAVGHSGRAFTLAEQHADFRTLTLLSHQLEASQEAARQRAEKYLDRYGQAFAFQLFQWYIEQGRLRTLLDVPDKYSPLLLDFFERSDNPRLAWLHDILLERHSTASRTLVQIADSEGKAAQKKLMLSLGKLAHCADLTEAQIMAEDEQDQIELIDDQLDMVNAHQLLRDFYESVIPGCSRDVENGCAAVSEAVAYNLESLPALHAWYASAVRSILRGDVVSAEDLIDLLTLPLAADDRIHDYTTALEVYLREKGTSEARLDASLASVWLRILLRDDWPSITDTSGKTDAELSDQLRHTALYAALKWAADHSAQSNWCWNLRRSWQGSQRLTC
ncbi:hypothetical protein IE81DRAFT_171999 [Ceraceosorus guamensis]|uniref:Nucleoporin Nup133/Nup155-like C-terminal domain-containing protein n=1 Tax=Ceraceosorus guamensis TaxID=1522189 RepID=A0A316VXB9_9BASI|nr:hypothetical protein IE81DRAFT_171999 [Ceraceosorus guamensis]PWN41568.1 hypothetical protein IE81DRAFT_171999 [Ceraceosorus guamensis]